MPSRWGARGGMVALALLLGAGPAGATVENLKSFKKAYPGKTAYSCSICHQGVVGRKGNLNAYGLALQRFKSPAPATELSTQDFRAIEQDDADGDGVSNVEEINAGTAPGDPASVPVAHAVGSSDAPSPPVAKPTAAGAAGQHAGGAARNPGEGGGATGLPSSRAGRCTVTINGTRHEGLRVGQTYTFDGIEVTVDHVE